MSRALHVYGKSALTTAALIQSTAGIPLEVYGPTNKAPLKVNSGVKVTNLNADRLDDKDSSGFLGAGAKAADSDKLDGNDSSAFLPAGAKAADADQLDGNDSSGFLGATAKAADADKLDGLDSTALGVNTLQGPVFGVCFNTPNQWAEYSKIDVTVPAGKTYRALLTADGSVKRPVWR